MIASIRPYEFNYTKVGHKHAAFLVGWIMGPLCDTCSQRQQQQQQQQCVRVVCVCEPGVRASQCVCECHCMPIANCPTAGDDFFASIDSLVRSTAVLGCACQMPHCSGLIQSLSVHIVIHRGTQPLLSQGPKSKEQSKQLT